MTKSALAVDASKDSGGENFPVGSFLLPKVLRPHVMRFYAFAREADDIADAPHLPPQEKISRLNAYAETLQSGHGPVSTALRLRQSLDECGVTQQHALDLISAFQQDAVKQRYANWGELMDYCNRSASPVGRYLLDLHGEDPAGYPASDMLCNALQVINHLQDCGKDYREMDRVYLPLDWISGHGAQVENLASPHLTGQMRAVLNRCLEETRGLLVRARPLLPQCKSKRLGAESAVILALAERLVEALANQDPLAQRVVFSKPRMALIAVGALARYALPS
ncbi:MAG: squalene synthase HpnC [Pseudomonadota bacterium]